MLSEIHDVIQAIAVGMEIAAVGVIVAGALIAVFWFLKAALSREGIRHFPREAYDDFRLDLGRGLLIGLELLVAAEIIHTAAAQTFTNLELVGGIVTIRTALVIVMSTEVNRRWPWQAEAATPAPITLDGEATNVRQLSRGSGSS